MSHYKHDSSNSYTTQQTAIDSLNDNTETTSKFLDAQHTFYTACVILNHLMENFNDALHLVRLREVDSSTAVIDSFHLNSVVDSNALKDDSITYNSTADKGKMADSSVGSGKVVDIKRKNINPANISSDGTTDSSNLITVHGVVNIIDDEVLALGTVGDTVSQFLGFFPNLISWTGFEWGTDSTATYLNGRQGGVSSQLKWGSSRDGDYADLIAGAGRPFHGSTLGTTSFDQANRFIVTGLQIRQVYIRSRGRPTASGAMTNSRYDKNLTLFGRQLGYR